MDRNNTYVKLISILVTFFIFLGALVLMRKYAVSMPVKIGILIVMIIIIDFIKSKIFK